MPTYHPGRCPASLVLALLVWGISSADAQQRKYFAEVGAAAGANSFDDTTRLGGSAGGLVRLGVWLPANFSVEGEAAFASPRTEPSDVGVNVRTLTGSLLYNLLVGEAISAYVKAGGGSTTYGGDCPENSTPGAPICGSSGVLLFGGGARLALTPSLMLRGEVVFNRNSSDSISFSNYGLNLGVSLMLGRPIPDTDGDGVLDNRDTCPASPAGAEVDRQGCTSDLDGDGIANGIDRCPGTAAGARVDPTGCPRDSDADNILDGIDRCPETPSGVLVDPQGCPRDSDGDTIADGLDRCSDTPKGATVDALGCPGDEDGDGVLDGLDRCPRTVPGATVDATGCIAGAGVRRQEPAVPQPPVRQPAVRPPAAREPAARPPADRQPPPAAQAPRAGARRARGTIGGAPAVLEGVTFIEGTARLRPESYVALDSIADVLLADAALRVEVAGHTDNAGTPAENLRISTLQAEAVRAYLTQKGVPERQVVARGFGATLPLTPDTSPRGRARNRRIEIRKIDAAP